jgi:hypothetical protein
MGHSRSRVAMVYQHASRERDEAIAAGQCASGRPEKAARPRSGAAGTWARESIMILAAMTSVVALTWSFGLERAKGNRTLMTSLELRENGCWLTCTDEVPVPGCQLAASRRE